ncbi:MAG: aldo/keto reductase [Devosia sp.]
MEVSRLCLGCMAFGTPGVGRHSWAMDEAASRPLLKRAVDLGINFFDTANIYSAGTSEEIVGKALSDYLRREDYVIATKLNQRVRPGPNGGGLSRKAIRTEIDLSLRRLKVDYVDLYQIHRWDATTPIEETMEALNDLVRAGKVLYIGASSMYAWQFAQSLAVSKRNGWARFSTMQNHVNLLYREEEREMIPLCVSEGVAVIPWSPLARGRLTRPWGEQTHRSGQDNIGKNLYAPSQDVDRQVVDAVHAVAARRKVSAATVALSWVANRPGITAPIIGATSIAQLEELVAAPDFQLSPQECEMLESPYAPHPVQGYE